MRDWLSHRVAATPDASALVRAEDGETWSYGDLDRLVAETAGRLSVLGIEPGDHLGVLCSARVGYVGLVHAAMRLGVTLVPLGDDLTPRELRERTARAEPTALVCGAETEGKAVAVVEDGAEELPLLSVDDPDHERVSALHDADPVPIDPPTWELDDRLCLLFTSGTTGEPKAVELTAANVLASAVANAFRLGVSPGDRWLVTLSLHHMGGLAPVYRCALYGTTLVLRRSFDPGGAADDIDRYDVTGVSLVPTMLTRMLDSRGTLADSLSTVLLGGAPAPDALIERCENYSIPVYPTYGMTEAASGVATATPEEAVDRLGTVGRPLLGTDLTVVDDSGSPVGVGETGEIAVDGPTVTPGYYRDPDANRRAFGEHGLRTGDVGYRDEDGYLYVLNRRDDRIITGGENVEPGEVAAVLREHPGVADVAVAGLPDEEWGERVAALVVPVGDDEEADAESEPNATTTAATGDDERPVDPAALLGFARERLAGFKLPRTVGFADELPRTVSGTVDRGALRERLLEAGFEPERPDTGFDAAGFEPADPEPAGAEPADAADVESADAADSEPADPSSPDRGSSEPADAEPHDADRSDGERADGERSDPEER